MSTQYCLCSSTITFIIALLNTITTHSSKPNFIIFYFDDLLLTQQWNASIPDGDNINGYNISYFSVPTPNINSIMNQGIVFPRAYAAAPACAPSRYALLTGKLPTRCAYAIEQTGPINKKYGPKVTVPNSKISQYGDDSQYNIQSILQNNGYYTGQTGKWHLMTSDDNGYNYNCSELDIAPNPILYENCSQILKTQGFDFIDGYYHGNIGNNGTNISHNIEWMVSVSQKFINKSINEENKPFFLYFSTTLAHDPNVLIANVLGPMRKFTFRDTPKGQLSGDDIPTGTGMVGRDKIWNMTLTALNITAYDLLFSNFSMEVVQQVASAIWLDNAIGAMIDYLKEMDIYNNTFIVLSNDHGYYSKGTLYEHGSRTFQYVRYPPLFGIDGYVLPDDFVVANYDLAPVIFNLSESVVPDDYSSEIDGTNWLPDVLDEINGNNAASEDGPPCCTERYMDIFNSHALVTKDNKYIFRATDQVWMFDPDPAEKYPYLNDTEQFYRLNGDPTEQNNRFDSISNDIVFDYRAKMTNYIENIACLSNDISNCVVPNITEADIPGYTCAQEVEYERTWRGVWVADGDYNESFLLNQTENILSTKKKNQGCKGFEDFNIQEYVYKFENPKPRKLILTMLLCCTSGKSFGSKYKIWPSGYDGNDVYNQNTFVHENEYKPTTFVTSKPIANERSENEEAIIVEKTIETENSFELYNYVGYFVLFIMTLIGLYMYYCCYQRDDDSKYVLIPDDNQLTFVKRSQTYGSMDQCNDIRINLI